MELLPLVLRPAGPRLGGKRPRIERSPRLAEAAGRARHGLRETSLARPHAAVGEHSAGISEHLLGQLDGKRQWGPTQEAHRADAQA